MEIAGLRAEILDIDQTLRRVISERDALADKLEALKADLTAITADRNELWSWKSVLWAENNELKETNERLSEELLRQRANVLSVTLQLRAHQETQQFTNAERNLLRENRENDE